MNGQMGQKRNQMRRQLLGTLLLMAAVLAGCGTFGNAETEKSVGSGNVKTDKAAEITVHEEYVAVPGLQEEVTLVFLADTHVSLCDERDPELLEKAAARYEGFRNAEGEGADVSFQTLMEYAAKEEPELLILGGDIVDSAMWASIDFVKEALEETDVPWIYEMGNHDFEYGTEYFSDRAYTEYLSRFSQISNTHEGCQITEYDDFVIFAVDDKNSQVGKEAVRRMKELAKQDKPVILVTHVPIQPLGDDALLEETKQVWNPSEDGHSRVLMGPDACVPNETTQEFLDLVLDEESPVVLVLAGHIHFYHKDQLTEDILQVVTGAGFETELVKVTLQPESTGSYLYGCGSDL